MKELKATKVLKKIINIADYGRYMEEQEIIKEAIKELEELNNRSCENCKRRKACNIWDYAGIPIDSLKDFCCNGWKSNGTK